MTSERLRILTVGDGDLSYSLALRRCFGEQIELTATTLLSEAELTSTYTRSSSILDELRERGVDVRFEVDATALALGPADVILFSFPHLGLTDLSDEALAARRRARRTRRATEVPRRPRMGGLQSGATATARSARSTG